MIHNHRNVTFVKVYDRTADAVIEYVGDREQIIELLRHFHYESANVPQTVIKTSGRELFTIMPDNTYRIWGGTRHCTPALHRMPCGPGSPRGPFAQSRDRKSVV